MGPLAFLSFVPSWAWKYAGIALALVALYGVADRKATYRERAKCEAAAQAAQAAANKQDQKANTEVQLNEKQTIAQLQEQKRKDDVALQDLQVRLAGRPLSAPCYYPDATPTGRVRNR